MEHLNKETFKDKIFDYSSVKDSNDIDFKNKVPVIIDFYADWCAPCKIVSPILEDLSSEYGDKLDVFKINTEEEPELAAMFGIRNIPSFLFVPTDGTKPRMAVGALPKENFKEVIKDVFNM